MKKILCLIGFLVFVAGCTAVNDNNSTNFDQNGNIVTLFSSKTDAQDKAWVGTFQIVFNDMKNHIFKQDIEFVGEKPTEDLIGLNNEEFKADMLNESSYYKSYGETSPQAKEKIKKAIKEKFNETSELLDLGDWSKSPTGDKFYAYAMLKKEFEFLKEFDILDKSTFNGKGNFDYFAIKSDSNKELYKNVKVLFYNNDNDYAVMLNTKTNDEIYLYRNDKNDTLKNLWDEMNDKAQKYKGNTYYTEHDKLKVPNIKVAQARRFDELCGKIIKGTNRMFSLAIETLQFELDSKGGKVKSEALIMTDNAMAPIGKIECREFNFDKTFNIFLVDSGKTEPYLGMRIFDLSKFQNKEEK